MICSRFRPHLACVLLACSAAGCSAEDAGTKMVVFSDPHYFAPALRDIGAALEGYTSQDRKLLAESDAIMRAMVDRVAAEKPDLVLISGDLTKDGELASHQGMASYLAQMEAGGATVLVVPGNHDVLNPGASSYSGSTATPVPNVTPEQFAGIYQELGYAEAKERDPAGTLSYLAEPRPGLWILALDTAIYAPGQTSAPTSGRISRATLDWVKAKLAEAQAQGATVIGMQHHGLIEHFQGQAQIFSGFLIDDFAAVGAELADAGLHVMLTGHFHASDVTTNAAGTLLDIETGSTVTAPCAYRVMNLHGTHLAVSTPRIDHIDYDLGGQDFQTYAHDKLLSGLDQIIAALISSPPYQLAPADAAQIAPLLASGLTAHYAGDESIQDLPAAAADLMSSTDTSKQLAGRMLFSIYSDLAPSDLTLTVDLATGAASR